MWFLEVQVENSIQRFLMKDREEGLSKLAELNPKIGKGSLFSRKEGSEVLTITSQDGQGALVADRIYAVRLVDDSQWGELRQREIDAKKEINAAYLDDIREADHKFIQNLVATTVEK